jgi:beta-lactamase class A
MWKLLLNKINQFNGFISVGVKDLNSEREFYFNEKEVFPAASIIKVPILIALFRQIEKQKISPEQKIILKEKDKARGAGILFELHEGLELTVLDLAKLMIVISDNTATNLLIDCIGFDEINAFMKDIGMEGSFLKRKMMVPYYREDQENLISTIDIISLMEKLLTGKLLSLFYTEQSIKILKGQQYNEKIPLYLPEGLEIAHKTGEIEGIRHDAGAIYMPDRVYLLSILTRNVSNVIQADRDIAEISRIIYDIFSQ